MPSAKADKSAIKRMRRIKGRNERPDDIFEKIRPYALDAISGGYINQDRAKKLLWRIGLELDLDYFPYSVLRNWLTYSTNEGVWNQSIEHDLLYFISVTFGEWDNFAFSGLIAQPLTALGDLYPSLFDSPSEQPVKIEGMLCDMTGPFAGISRKDLYTQTLELGGTPCEDGWFLDYLFVAKEHQSKRAISNAMFSAINSRMRYGITRIYREEDFPLTA